MNVTTVAQPAWNRFPVYLVELEFRMTTVFRTPPFSGSLFRGALGWALKECCEPTTYRYLFETESEAPGHADAARPFVLQHPMGQLEFQPGDPLRLYLKLFGQACRSVASFIEALELAVQNGLGHERAQGELTKVLVHDGAQRWVCFDAQGGHVSAQLPAPNALETFCRRARTGKASAGRELVVEYLTPTRLLKNGKRLTEPDLSDLLLATHRRLSSLLRFHSTGEHIPELEPIPIDLSELQEISAEHHLSWQDWTRSSNRQKRRITMGGLLGNSRFYASLPASLRELLLAGQFCQVGKATTFGMGSFRVLFDGSMGSEYDPGLLF